MRIDDEVLAVLSRAETRGNNLVLVGQLERSLYARTDKVLRAAGGKWDRKAKAHVFVGDAAERMEQVLLTGNIEVPRDDYEFFPTPPEVAARVIAAAQLDKPGLLVLEPSAGRGALALPAAAAGATVDCCELMQANHEHLEAQPGLRTVARQDFLTTRPERVYDRVVMNPPFSRQADIRHVQHALQFLKPGGLLVSVMAASVAFRENKLTTDFRALVAACGGTIKALPENSFKASGTEVRTVLAVIPA